MYVNTSTIVYIFPSEVWVWKRMIDIMPDEDEDEEEEEEDGLDTFRVSYITRIKYFMIR